MTEYQKAGRRRAERIFKKYDESHAIVEKFLREHDAPLDVLNAFNRASNAPTVTRA